MTSTSKRYFTFLVGLIVAIATGITMVTLPPVHAQAPIAGKSCGKLKLDKHFLSDGVLVWGIAKKGYLEFYCKSVKGKRVWVAEKKQAKYLKSLPMQKLDLDCETFVNVHGDFSYSSSGGQTYFYGGKTTFYQDGAFFQFKCEGPAKSAKWQSLDNLQTPSSSQGQGSSATNPQSDNVKSLNNACRSYASAIVDFEKAITYFTSAYLLQEAQRALAKAESSIYSLTATDPTLSQLKAAIQVMSKHAWDKFSAGRISTVDPNVLRMAVGTFNSICKTSVYVSP